MKTEKKMQLKKLINILKRNFEIHEVYLIGYQEHRTTQKVHFSPKTESASKSFTFSLLIIFEGAVIPLAPQPLKEFLEEELDQESQVYSLSYSMEDILQSLDTGNEFLNRILRHSRCLYANDTFLNQWKYGPCPSPVEQLKEEWETRKARAFYLWGKIAPEGLHENETSRLSILYDALEQICLGLLSVYWDLRPKHYPLDHLLQFCSHFTRPELFPDALRKGQCQWDLLLEAKEIHQKADQKRSIPGDTEEAFEKYGQFLRQARDFGDKALGNLQKASREAQEEDQDFVMELIRQEYGRKVFANNLN